MIKDKDFSISTQRYLFRTVGILIKRLRLYTFFKFTNDGRPSSPFKVVFFSGKSGIEYLNASLFSIYNCWNSLPEIIIVTDGTPASVLSGKLITWPRDITIISWKDCADHYKSKGNHDIYMYALKELWGKKFLAILYCAERFPTLYSDTDVLWYSPPKEDEFVESPFLKMAQDVEECYSSQMLKDLQEEHCLTKTPLNAGVIYAKGDFSLFPKWKILCEYLNLNADNRSEQTAFGILNNHFNEGVFWNKNEVLIKIDDTYQLRYTKSLYPAILARHYVSTKQVTFWRDFLYMCIKR